MLVTLGAILLAAAPATVKVAVPGFTVVGMEAGLGEAWTDRFITLLSKDGDFKLITARDIQQVLGLERQKQLLGCGDEQASCLAELAGALGVDAILSGSFAKAGNSITATLRVLKAADGSQIAAATGRVKDADELQDWLEAQAPELAAQLRTSFNLAAPVRAAAPPSVAAKSSGGGTPIVRWVPAIIGGATLIGGAVLFGLSKSYASQLRSYMLTNAEIPGAASTGSLFESLGLGMMIGGGVAIAASVVWALAAPSSAVKVAFVPSASGGTLSFGGTF